MRILSVCLTGKYTDGHTYQENLLSKYFTYLGYESYLIANTDRFDEKGKAIVLNEEENYTDKYGTHIYRIKYKNGKLSRRLRKYIGLKKLVYEIDPDVIFVHGVQFADISYVIDFVKQKKEVKLYIDNHADYSNSAQNFLSKTVLHKIVWRHYAKSAVPYTTKFYGVLPARVDFLKEVYKIPDEKIELLVMGADDEMCQKVRSDGSREKIRNENGIKDTDVLLLTGGKIDSNRPQTLDLMKAAIELDAENVKMIVFGTPSEELKEEFEKLCESERIIYVGWLDAESIYRYFAACDLVIFPGLHSVLWEQAAGMGKPCLFKKIDGFGHLDIGGNCRFIENTEPDYLKSYLSKIIGSGQIDEMKQAAEEKCTNYFSYKAIAERAVKD